MHLQALVIRKAEAPISAPTGKCEIATPAQARRKQKRLWWLRSCLLGLHEAGHVCYATGCGINNRPTPSPFAALRGDRRLRFSYLQ